MFLNLSKAKYCSTINSRGRDARHSLPRNFYFFLKNYTYYQNYLETYQKMLHQHHIKQIKGASKWSLKTDLNFCFRILNPEGCWADPGGTCGTGPTRSRWRASSHNPPDPKNLFNLEEPNGLVSEIKLIRTELHFDLSYESREAMQLKKGVIIHHINFFLFYKFGRN